MSNFFTALLLCMSLNAFAHTDHLIETEAELEQAIQLIEGIDSFELLNSPNKSMVVPKSKIAVTRANLTAQLALLDAKSKTNPGSSLRNLIVLLQRQIKLVSIKWAPAGTNFNRCVEKPNVLAFAIVGRPNVYLCNLAFEDLSDEGMAQTIIHELVHTLGVADECNTSAVERHVMSASRFGLVYDNGYTERCGF